jgi:hypothetical protein
MAFKDLVGKAQELTGTATAAAGSLMDEFNETVPTLRSLGFSVQDLRVGMGFVPEIAAKLIASIDDVEISKVHELADKHKDKKLLSTVLKAVETALNIRQQLGGLKFHGIEVDVTLGLPPHIGVGFINPVPQETAHPAAAATATPVAA